MAPGPDRARRLTRSGVAAATRRASWRNIEAQGTQIQQILRADELHRSTAVQSAHAAIVASQASIVQTLNAPDRGGGCGGGCPFWSAPRRRGLCQPTRPRVILAQVSDEKLVYMGKRRHPFWCVMVRGGSQGGSVRGPAGWFESGALLSAHAAVPKCGERQCPRCREDFVDGHLFPGPVSQAGVAGSVVNGRHAADVAH
jgi:hypothetical protein